MKALEKLFNYYLDHQNELVKEYNGKHIIIVDNKVVGAYDSLEEAYNYAIANYDFGNFIIQLCTPGTDAYTQTFHSRVVIA